MSEPTTAWIEIIKTCSQPGRNFKKGETIETDAHNAKFLIAIGNAKPAEAPAPAPAETPQ